MTTAGPNVEVAPAGDGFVARLRDVIAQAQRDDALAQVTVVTPSFHSSFFLRRATAAAATGRPGLFNVDFVRVEDIAERLTGTGLRGKLPLSRLVASQLVAGAALRADPDGPLGTARHLESFHQALHRTLTELKPLGQSGLRRLAQRGGHFPELAALAAEYTRLSSRFYDRTDVSAAAVRHIEVFGYAPPELGAVIVLLVEPPPPQYRELVLALTRVRGAKVLAVATGSRAADEGLFPSTPRLEPAPAAGPEPVRLPAGGQARLVSTQGPDEEARWVVRNVLDMARRGTRFGQIAVFHPGGSYGARVEEGLKLAGIPVSGPDRRPAAAWPEGRFLTGLLEARKEFSRDAVAAWLTSAPVRSPESGGLVPGSRWDAVSRLAGVTRGLERWERGLSLFRTGSLAAAERASKDPDQGDEAAARRAKSDAEQAGALLVFMRGFAERATPPVGGWQSHVTWLRSLQHDYLGVQQSEEASERATRIDKVLDRVSELDHAGLAGPDPERFTQVIVQELGRPAGRGGRLGAGVFVAQLRDAPGTVFEAVHVLGMAEPGFPGQDNPDPLLPDPDRRALDPSGELLPLRDQRRAAHLRQYLLALAAGRNRFLIWPRAVPGATRESGPAWWFVEAARHLSGDPTLQATELGAKARGSTWLEWQGRDEFSAGAGAAPADRHEYDVWHVANWLSAGRNASAHPTVTSPGSPLAAAIKLEHARYSGRWTEWDGAVRGQAAAGNAGMAGPASPTRYQDWAACPFRYFLAHVLAIEASDRPEELLEIAPLERGRLVHSILDTFVRRRQQAASPSLSDQLLLLAGTATSECAQFERQNPTGHRTLWEIEKRHISRALSHWLRREQLMLAGTGQGRILTEVGFGIGDGGAGAVPIQLDGARAVQFRGVIDRIDVHDDGRRAAVYDYKTSNPESYKKLKDDPVLRGTRLQLPVYALAARAILTQPAEAAPPGQAPETVSAAYWFVMNAGDWLIPAPQEFNEANAVAAARRVVGVIHDGVSAGVFPARPGPRSQDNRSGQSGYENCNWCDYKRICPSAKAWLWERKRGDPALLAYAQLAEGGPPHADEDAEAAL